jgi:tRNA pseudouridine13 synthase
MTTEIAMSPDEPVIKHLPEEFLVRENMVVKLSSKADATHQYLLLRKCRYTTMEACRLIAESLGVEPGEVSYGGLKDEDAITEQLVGVPKGSFREHSNGALAAQGHPARWLQLQHYGYGVEPLQVGMLEGNGFHLVIRNLSGGAADVFRGVRKLPTFFLNYYDIQRFGVPEGPKRTHFVGSAMLAQRWDDALRELVGLRAPESELATAWTGDPHEFFRQLDPRTASFYLAAYASHDFNAELAGRVMRRCPDENLVVEVEGLCYRYVTSPQAATSVVAADASLPYARYAFDDGIPVERSSRRTTAVQVAINVCSVDEDESYAGRHKASVRFFLPSGCYATAAIRQITRYRRSEIGGER